VKIILGCDPLLTPLTGIGHYTQKLGRGLIENSEVEQLKLFAHGKFFSCDMLINNNAVNEASDIEISESRSLLSHIREKLASSSMVVKAYQKASPHIMRYSLRKHADCIYHSPNFTLPPFEGRKIVTIHDLSTIKYPEYHPKSRVDFVNDAILNSIEKADHIITDSDFVKNEIIDTFSINSQKITPIHLGADQQFKPRNEIECCSILKLHDLEYEQFFLFVSTIEPRKNLLMLLNAFTQYRMKNPNGLPLVLIGGGGWNNNDILQKIAFLSEKGWVKYLGYLPQIQIPILYSSAKALLFPSIYEGFGLPVLEAMQSGTAVVTCSNSSMSEICEDSAALITPNDTDKLVDEISKLEQDPSYCEVLVKKGLLRAAHFSWQKCISQTLSVYNKLA